jgi:ribosomal protein S18 acetylase RimI-like enzyme
MIRSATPEDFPAMLDLQITCVNDLEEYTPKEREIWADYLRDATPERYGNFESTLITDISGIAGFASWIRGHLDTPSTIECLYVRKDQRNRNLGQFLLAEAEMRMPMDADISVRSTLGARSFYEAQGYEYVENATSRAGFAVVVLEKKA